MFNLERLAAGQAIEPKRKADGAYALCGTDDGYAAARILCPSFMARLRDTLGSPTICVGIPNRDFLVAWTPDFELRRRFATQVADDAAGRDDPFNDSLFVSSESGVRLMNPQELADHGR